MRIQTTDLSNVSPQSSLWAFFMLKLSFEHLVEAAKKTLTKLCHLVMVVIVLETFSTSQDSSVGRAED